MYTAEPGDILLYRKLRTFTTQVIDALQTMESGRQTYEYYHVAIALNADLRIESDGKTVLILPMDYGAFDPFRPPIPPQSRDAALDYVQGFIGQKYDWWVIVDDTLRYLSRNLIHLPVSWIQSAERRHKICSSLVARYFEVAGWGPNMGPNVSPEDIYLAVKDFALADDR